MAGVFGSAGEGEVNLLLRQVLGLEESNALLDRCASYGRILENCDGD